jgi:tRNA threonylcarbamoyladenosine biosynthesis protein TsaE
MQTWFFDSPDPEHTSACAVALGQAIGVDGLVIALVGPLGAGKTVFVKGLAEGLGVDPRLVSSPTFVIAQQYPLPSGPETLHHVDLYRLESAVELEPLGFDDMLGKGQVLAVEWADRFPEILGSRLIQIEFEGPSPAEEDAAREGVEWRGRRARVSARGEKAESVLADWAERVESSTNRTGGGGHRLRPEARLSLLLILGLGAVIGSHFGSVLGTRPVQPVCELLSAESWDGLGTLRARCMGDEEGESQPLTGIARLLDGGRINLNRASVELLRTLPQIGSTRANAIIRARESRAHGRFSNVQELVSVHGIGPKTLEQIERWLYVSSSAFENPLRSSAERLTTPGLGGGTRQSFSDGQTGMGSRRGG